jgi:putative ABC transport system permease protein
MSDLRYAIRLLRKSPLFTITVVLTIALGIGASTAIFSVVNAILVRPLPFGEPQRLIQMAEKNDALKLPSFGTSALNYFSWKERTKTVAEMGAIQFGAFTLTGRGDPETYPGNAISTSLMPMLRLQPVAGRAFAAGDDAPGGEPVALISEALWKRRFGGDPAIIGRPAMVDGKSYTVVGIAPAALTTLTNGEIFVPLVIEPAKEMRLNHVLFVVGRLAPGVTMQAAQSEMDTIALGMTRQFAEMKDWGVTLITFTDTFISRQLRTALLVLLGATVFLLLIVSANVANLLLSRALERQREMAIRAALGAGRSRLWRQLLIESLALSVTGGVAGFLVAVWGVRLLSSSLPPNLLPVPDIGIDPTVVLFAVGVTMVTGVVFGLAPAWQSANIDVNTTLKSGGRSASGGLRPLLRKSLAGAELALATVLLIGAVLLVRSLLELQRVPLGFDPDGVLTFQVAVSPTRYDMPKRIVFHHQLIEAIRAIPGVRSAGLSSGIPFGVGNYTQSPVSAPGKSALPPDASVPIDWRVVSPGYFQTVKMPILRGRDFTDSDTDTAPSVMIVSRRTARTLWGDEDPIGRTIRRVADKKDFTVVGLVGDVRSTSLNRESPALYYSSGVRTWALMDIVLRSDTDQGALIASIRRAVSKLDPQIPVSNVRPMTEWVSTSAAQPRLNAWLLAVFACVALLVAGIGTYGVLAYSVSQRTKELGLRMALGADRRHVLKLIVREGMIVGSAGIILGVLIAGGMSRALSSIVFGVSVWDPLTYAGALAALTAITLVSCLVPAFRASRVDPMHALRLD